MFRGVTLVVAVVLSLVLSSCGGDDDSTVLVMAAASLAGAFSDIEEAFEGQHPDLDVQLNIAGSASLREQILQGAPGDVFASANTATMQQLTEAEAVGAPTIFATNELALAVPIDNPGQVTGIEDLANEELLVGVCAQGVPCGDFARQVFEQVGVVAAIDTNERDVRSLVTKISAGELDAGIVYVTDVRQSTEMVEIELPPQIAVDIRYPIVSIAEAPNMAGAIAFIDFVQSPAGQTILGSYGFGAP